MNRITEITKRDILDLFQNGLEIDEFFQIRTVTYNYYGRLEEIDFLKRLYDLERMPSFDSRFVNAEQDIWQHTVNNDDYPYCWVFEDKRFNLQDGSDEVYLKFLCEVFHPAVRYDKGYWKEFLVAINKLLQNDGYEIYPAEKISNRDVYGWRIYQQEDNTLFIPYSQRNAKAIKAKKIVLSIKRKARNQIYQFLERYNIVYQATDETGWNYNTTVAEDVFNEIRQFYVPKCYNDKKEYDKQTAFINNSMTVIGNIENIKRIKCGDYKLNLSAAEVRYNIAKSNGWSENLDMSIPFNKQIDEIYNPNALLERVCTIYEIMKNRRDLVTDNKNKLPVILDIINRHPDKQFVVISKRGEFAAEITKYLNNNNIKCGDYHDNIESAIAVDDNGVPILIKSGKDKGKPKIVCSQAISSSN